MVFLCSPGIVTAENGGYAVIDTAHISNVRKLLADGNKLYRLHFKNLVKNANKLLDAIPLSVMDKVQIPPSGDKHDFMSMAAYWWANPEIPNDSYIRKDGERNPEAELVTDNKKLEKTIKSFFSLSLAYVYTGEEKYAEKALQLADVWFINPETKMNPNLNFAQSIKNKNDGRGSGIIDSRVLIYFTDGLRLLEKSTSLNSMRKSALNQWLTDYFIWLCESKHGQKEAQAENNHGTWYLAQCAAIGSYIGRHAETKQMLMQITARIEAQVDTGGKQPFELIRTTSFHYSHFNLLALGIIINEALNYDLSYTDFSTAGGHGYKRAVEFLYPYCAKEKEWTYPQISTPRYSSPIRAYLLAGKLLNDKKYFKLAQSLDVDNLKDAEELLYITGY